MLWLPGLNESGVTWRLPLADHSAPALLSTMLAREGQCAVLREALEHDPALALWAVLSAARAGSNDLRSVDALAHWLMLNVRASLSWSQGAEQTPDDDAWRERYHRLSAVSVAVARGARELASGQSEAAEQAVLVGLLHAAQQWPSLDPAYVQDAEKDRARALPAWLARALDRLHETPPDDGADAVSYVCRARQALDETAALTHYDRLCSRGPLAAAALSELARCLPSLSRQLDRLQPSPADFEERLEAAKLAAMGEFAAGAGHEINNPIAVIAGRAQLLLHDEKNAQRRHELAVINSQAMRVYEMIADMMLFARAPLPKFAPCDLAAVTRQVTAEMAPKAGERSVVLQLELPAGPMVINADATQLAVVLRALCDNALAAVERGGKILIRLGGALGSGSEEHAVVLAVTDDGIGISDEVRQHLFDPFFSGRQAGRGLGIGLAKVWRIVQNHHGHIDVKNEAGGGTTFTVVLPVTAK